MVAVMYGATGSNKLVELRETPYQLELHLQAFLTQHPGLLAGDQMNPVEPRRFVLITAEAGIAIAKDSGDYFSLDHLFIDQDGIPTLVEVKRSSDTRLRREVIGQMLEYAANACAHWSADRLRTVFEKRCPAEGIALDEELSNLAPGATVDADSVWDKVAQNLSQQRLRLVFVSDKFSPETQRIVEFLDRQMQSTEVYAVEVRQFTGSGMTTLSPRVLNPSVLQTDRRSAISRPRGERWTEERFYGDAAERLGNRAVQIFHEIAAQIGALPNVKSEFGSGKADGSLNVSLKGGSEAARSRTGADVFLSLWTFGRIEFNFQNLLTREMFAGEDKRRELRRRLMTGSTLDIPDERIALRPSIMWSDLDDATNMQAFKAAIEWIVAELNS